MTMVADEDVVVLVKAYAAKHYGADAARDRLDADSDLAAFGLDSVDLVCVAAEFEEKFGVAIEPAAFLTLPTIASVLADLRRLGTIG